MRVNKIIKSIISLLITFMLIFPLYISNWGTIKAEASGLNTLDETFVPSRSFYPYYLSKYSSYDSELIKGIWEKLFYEQRYDSNWSKKYYIDESTDYVAIGGLTKSFEDINFITTDGDFDAFLGNTLEANEEFLGELLGLPSYISISSKSKTFDDTNLQDTMRYVIYTKMSNPDTYKSFARAMAGLTKNGSYLDGTLKNSSYNNQNFEIWMLVCLASLYEGDGDETYLSDIQVTWLKDYELQFYDAFTSNSNATLKNIVETYAPIKDLIARSWYASNNRNGYGQYFFDYVVDSGKGAGAWLNQIDGVDISGLNTIDDIVALFLTSEGFCYGHENEVNCTNHALCLSHSEGGKATLVDEYAYYINKNEAALKYIKGNSKAVIAYSNPESLDGGWLEKYKYKHSPSTGATDMFTLNVNIVSGGNAVGPSNSGSVSDCGNGGVHQESRAYATAYINLAQIDEKLASQPLSRTTSVTFYPSGTGLSIGGYSVTVNGTTISNAMVPRSSNGRTFDISRLSWEQRQNCVIAISLSAYHSCEYNPLDCNPRGCSYGYSCHGGGCTAQASIGTSSTATIAVKREKCFSEGHIWAGTVDWNDYQNATITYTCKNDVKHTFKVDAPVTSANIGDYIVYTVSGEPYVYDFEKNKYDTYSTRVNATSGESSETIALNGSTTNGVISKTVTSSGQYFPDGSRSKYHYTDANAPINFTIKAGTIKAGTKQIRLNISASSQLRDLNIIVYDRTGKELAHNDSSDIYNCYLFGYSDGELRDCYVIVSARAYTIHWTTGAYALWENAPASTASISANSVVCYY